MQAAVHLVTQTADPLRDTAQHPFHIEILYLGKCTDMKKYEKAQMEIIEFEAEDVITTSGGEIGGGDEGFGD